MRRAFGFWAGVALAACLASCGGGGGGTPEPPVDPGTTDPPAGPQAAILFTEGTFFRGAGQVFTSQRLNPSAVLPSGASPDWRLVGPSYDPKPTFGVTTDGRLNYLPGTVGEYQLEVGAVPGGPALAHSALKVIPSQIEFILDVQHLPGGTTQMTVRPGSNPPMTQCIVYAAAGCQAPASIEAWLDGGSLGTPVPAGNFAYVFTTPTTALGNAKHGLHVRISAPIDASGTFGGRSREAFLAFDATGPAQVGVFGLLDANVASSLSIPFGATLRVGETLEFEPATTGRIFNVVEGALGAYRLVEKPAGSLASPVITRMSAPERAAIVVDKAGLYAMEYTPVFSDAQRASPRYAALLVKPHEIDLSLSIRNVPVTGDVPAGSPDKVRVALDPFTSRALVSVEAFLDGNSLGVLRLPNLFRYPGTTCGRIACAYPLFSYDIDKTTLGSSTHQVRFVVRDLAGFQAQVSVPVGATTIADQAFGPYYDIQP